MSWKVANMSAFCFEDCIHFHHVLIHYVLHCILDCAAIMFPSSDHFISFHTGCNKVAIYCLGLLFWSLTLLWPRYVVSVSLFLHQVVAGSYVSIVVLNYYHAYSIHGCHCTPTALACSSLDQYASFQSLFCPVMTFLTSLTGLIAI